LLDDSNEVECSQVDAIETELLARRWTHGQNLEPLKVVERD
jgi:hypothetical protein